MTKYHTFKIETAFLQRSQAPNYFGLGILTTCVMLGLDPSILLFRKNRQIPGLSTGMTEIGF